MRRSSLLARLGRPRARGLLLTALVVIAAALPAAGAADRGRDDEAHARTRTERHERHDRGRGNERAALPTWSGSFTTDGVAYPYTMVGTSPATGGTTRVPTIVIPLDLRFDDDAQPLATTIEPGCALDAQGVPVPASCVALDRRLDGGEVARAVLESPVLRRTDWPESGDSDVQYADALQRAQFDTFGDWHLELAPAVRARTQVIEVPPRVGVAHVNRRGVVVGRADVAWMDAQIDRILRSLRVPASVLPIVLTKDVYLYEGDVNACCYLGFHDASDAAGGRPQRTWIYAAHSTPGAFADPGIADVATLSHEVFEWVANPYLDNRTPPWYSDGYGCQDVLETGDGLVGVTFPRDLGGRTYHLQDAAFLPWFARESPSSALDGRYSYLDVLDGPADGCPAEAPAGP